MYDTLTLTDAVVDLLLEREGLLGTVECGVAGIVSHNIFESDQGPLVLGSSMVMDDAQEAIEILNLPRPQFKKAGDYSAKAARAAAREGRSFLGVTLCLVAWSEPLIDLEALPEGEKPSDQDEEGTLPHPVRLALNTGRKIVDQTIYVEGLDAEAKSYIINQAMEMVRQALS
jgi:hypothetical protein